ncbi:MarR family winged helix-turn-helix transcriptional regulator [Sphingomonas sp. CJ20]
MPRAALERSLATVLSPTSRAWQRLADQVLASLNVSSSSGWCLIYLDRLGPDVGQAELARTIGVTNASLVRTLHQLEAAGLVTRQSDPEDRRANKLRLTELGQARATEIEARLVDMRRQLLADVPDADLEAALRVCAALNDRIANWRA